MMTAITPVAAVSYWYCSGWSRSFTMAIQDYVRSIAAYETVSKDEVFRFLEMQFSRADRNHDGNLNLDELSDFVNAIVRPDADQR
jgi:hypothetical protein